MASGVGGRGGLAVVATKAVEAGTAAAGCTASEPASGTGMAARAAADLAAGARRRMRALWAAVVMVLAGAPGAEAGTGGADLPWNHPLQVVVDNLTGPTAKTIAALAFVLGGAMWMFTSHEQGAKRFGQALFGVAIVLGAVNLVDALGFQGATF